MYGPLISAISITQSKKSCHLSRYVLISTCRHTRFSSYVVNLKNLCHNVLFFLDVGSMSDTHGKGFSIGAVLGIIAACVLLLILISLYLFIKFCPRGLPGVRKGYQSNILQGRSTYLFSMEQIEAATEGFNPENKIGEGGFGSVYKVS